MTGQLWLDSAGRLQVSGLSTNVAFLRALCQHPAFEAAELDTSFIAKHMDALVAPAQPDASVLALAAIAWHLIALRVGRYCISACRPYCKNHKQSLLSRYMQETMKLVQFLRGGPIVSRVEISVQRRDT